MKFFSILAFLFALCQGAVAQTSECSTVPKASDRLACYDRATPPKAAKPAASKTTLSPDKTAASTAPANQGQIVDMLAVENSKLDAKIKNICRGC